MAKNRLGTEYMQAINTHFMGDGLTNREISPEAMKALQLKEEQAQLEMAERLSKDNEGAKNCDNYELFATGFTVIYEPYEKNPYRKLKTSASGLIYGFDAGGVYMSNETGELEKAELGIAWGKVISAGPECKYVKVGDDICFRNYGVPVPFDSKGYCAISEQNVICKTVNKTLK